MSVVTAADAHGRRWALGLTAAAQFVLQLDLAIVNVALPTVQRELGFTAAGLQWIVTGYALTFGSLLLLGGRLGDLLGHRRTVIGGLAVFGLASLSGGLAVSPGILIASRLVQGAGAALVAPAALALLTEAFPEPQTRTHAMGIFQGAVAAGALTGILAGGLITQHAGWRWVLLVNPPIVLVLVMLVSLRIPAARGHAGIRLDLPGALAATGAMGALILGVSNAEQHRLADPVVWAPLALAALLTAALVLIERRTDGPMLPAALLRGHRAVMIGAVLVLGAALAGYVYFASLYVQRVLGLSPDVTGLSLAPASAMVMLVSTQASRRLLPRLGTGWQLVVAFVLIGGGQLWLAQAAADGSYVADVLGPLLITSAGIGLALPAASLAMTHDVPPHQRGMAGALFAAGQQAGSAIGLAILATVAAATTVRTGDLAGGYQIAFLSVAILAAVTAVVMATSTLLRRTRT